MTANTVPLVAASDWADAINDMADLEQAIVQRLVAALTPDGKTHPVVDVQAWPDDPASYRLVHPVGAVLVVYQGSRTSQRDGALMPVTHAFAVRVLSRTLRDPNVGGAEARAGSGTYQLLSICRLALMGFTPEGASSPLVVTEVSFDDYDEGVWHHELKAQLSSAWLVPPTCVPGPWIVEGPGVCCETAPPIQQVTYSTENP